MSLIEDALRRAEQERPANKRPAARPPEPLSASSTTPISLITAATAPASAALPPAHTSRTTHTEWPVAAVQWLRLALVGTGVVAMVVWTYHVTIRSKPLVIAAPPALQAVASAPAETPADLPPPPPPEPVFALNGVVEGVGEPFAIINGVVVHLGETIEDATLIAVDASAAKLRRKNKELVLRTAQ